MNGYMALFSEAECKYVGPDLTIGGQVEMFDVYGRRDPSLVGTLVRAVTIAPFGPPAYNSGIEITDTETQTQTEAQKCWSIPQDRSIVIGTFTGQNMSFETDRDHDPGRHGLAGTAVAVTSKGHDYTLSVLKHDGFPAVLLRWNSNNKTMCCHGPRHNSWYRIEPGMEVLYSLSVYNTQIWIEGRENGSVVVKYASPSRTN